MSYELVVGDVGVGVVVVVTLRFEMMIGGSTRSGSKRIIVIDSLAVWRRELRAAAVEVTEADDTRVGHGVEAWK